MIKVPLFLLSSFIAAGCGGKAAEPPPAAPSSAASASAPAANTSAEPPGETVAGPPTVAWRDMTKEQRAKYMKAVVLPKMKEVFVAHDAKLYASLDCDTCHGKGATEGTFVMPNPDLPVLPGDPAGFQALAKEHPDAVEWMSEKVKPTMAALLGKEELDMKNPKPDTVGCGTCHSMKKK